MENYEEGALVAFFKEDHRRVVARFDQYRSLKRVNFKKAKLFFNQFQKELGQHIVDEQTVLFPLLQSLLGEEEREPIHSFEYEHRQVENLVTRLASLLERGYPTSDDEDQKFLSVFEFNYLKEEILLYPTIDRLISDEKRREILERLRANAKEKIPSSPSKT